ncbi:MAG: hypothetical protein LBB77_06685, partial [Treponema sp.]|nr:hypothetical protein [Treponema sp.]
MKNSHGNTASLIDIINDPFDFTYAEISGAIGERDSGALYSLLYKNSGRKVRTIWIKDVFGDAG